MCVFVLAIQSLLDLNTFYDLCYVNVFLLIIHLSSYPSPRGFAFTWWGCYGLCPRHKPTELAHSFYFVLVYVSVFMALSTIFHSINSPDNSPLSHCVLQALFYLIGPLNYIPLHESLPQP